tara:strand:- start:178 stop:447 length:270 start_codon:yes stop_codon:yes gene_type:complete
MEINDIVSHIMTKMTDIDELNHLKKVINMKRKDIARDLKYTLKAGDRVRIEGSKIKGGIIHKVNRTCAVIKDDNGQGWDVPLTMIRTGE